MKGSQPALTCGPGILAGLPKAAATSLSATSPLAYMAGLGYGFNAVGESLSEGLGAVCGWLLPPRH